MKIISRITIIAIAVSLSNAVVSQEKPLSQQVAATVLKIWPDTIPIAVKPNGAMIWVLF
jgi:hypothetical protein